MLVFRFFTGLSLVLVANAKNIRSFDSQYDYEYVDDLKTVESGNLSDKIDPFLDSAIQTKHADEEDYYDYGEEEKEKNKAIAEAKIGSVSDAVEDYYDYDEEEEEEEKEKIKDENLDNLLAEKYDAIFGPPEPTKKQTETIETVKISKDEEKLVFPKNEAEYSYDYAIPLGVEKVQSSVVPGVSSEDITPVLQSDESLIRMPWNKNEQESFALPVDQDQNQNQQPSNNLYTTAQRAHRLLTTIIQVSQNLFQHNEFILAIIQSLEVFNQEIAVEIEKFVDQIENVGELLQQIEDFSDENNREIKWTVGDSFAVNFVWDKSYAEEISVYSGTKKTYLLVDLQFGSFPSDFQKDNNNDFDFPKTIEEDKNEYKYYPNHLSFSLTQPSSGNDASFEFNSEGEISCLFLSKIELLNDFGVGCFDKRLENGITVDSIPDGAYGWQNIFLLQMHDSRQNDNAQNNKNDDWLNISFSSTFFADNIHYNSLYSFGSESRKGQLFSGGLITNGVVDINYPESTRTERFPGLVVNLEEIPVIISGQIRAMKEDYLVKLVDVIELGAEYKEPKTVKKEVKFETLPLTVLLNKSIDIKFSAYSIRQNINNPNDYSCFVSSLINPQDESDTCYLGIKIRPNNNLDVLELRIRKGLPKYTDHFYQGQQDVYSLAEISVHNGKKSRAYLELEHNLKSGFYEYNVGLVDTRRKVKSSLMVLRYADIETVKSWVNTLVDNVIPYIWAIETFAQEPGTILYADRVIMKLIPKKGSKIDLSVIGNAANLGIAFPRCLIDPATDNLSFLEYLQFLLENSEKCAVWVPADEFTEKIQLKIEKFLVECINDWVGSLKKVAYWVRNGRQQAVGTVETIQLIYRRVGTQVESYKAISGSVDQNNEIKVEENSIECNGQQCIQLHPVESQSTADKIQKHYDQIVQVFENIVDFIFDVLSEESRKKYIKTTRDQHGKCLQHIEWCRTRYFQDLEFVRFYFQSLVEKLQQEF